MRKFLAATTFVFAIQYVGVYVKWVVLYGL